MHWEVVLNHVLLHQTIIGLEAQKQMEKAGFYPDVVIGCSGGGSNFGGTAVPFVKDKIAEKANPRIIAVEPKSCPSLTQGEFKYDYGDVAHLTPKMMMYTLGSDFEPPGIHAGGLRYHGASPILSFSCYMMALWRQRLTHKMRFLKQQCCFTQNKGTVPAPESSHAIKAAIDEALAAKEAGETKTILFTLRGHGHFDMTAYDSFLSGKLND